MTNDIAKPAENQLIQTDAVDENALKVMNTAEYFPRLKLCQGGSKEVSAEQVAKGGHYALIFSKDELEDAEKDFEIVLVSARAKALRTGDEILQYFDPESAEFKAIEAESKEKDSGCMYGPEFLAWLPGRKIFATLFLCNPTGRRASKGFMERLGQGSILTSDLIKNDKFSWHGPTIKNCTTTITDLPDAETLTEAKERFKNEKSSNVKMVAADDTGDTGRAR